MLSKSQSYALILASLLVSGMAYADDNAAEHKAYVQFSAGAAFAPSFLTHSEGYICSYSTCSFVTMEQKETYDTGFAGSVALGYRIAEQFRLEAEVLYQSNNLGKLERTYSQPFSHYNHSFDLKGERERTAFLLNAYYDYKNSSDFTPYITAGLGGYHLRMKQNYSSIENDLDFAWQAGAGVNYRLNDRVSFDLKYRYFGGSDAELQYPTYYGTASRLVEVGDHQVMAGIRVGF